MEVSIEDMLKGSKIIPSVATLEQLKYAAEKADYPCVMLKIGDVNSIAKMVAYLHKNKKTVMLHIDSVKGIAKDKAGIHYLKRVGVDSIVTMKSQNLKMIKEEGIFSVLGTFLVDSASVALTIQNVNVNKPDALIIMPMTVPEEIYNKIRENVTIPVMAGGLGVTKEIIDQVLEIGVQACAVTDPAILKEFNKRNNE